MKKIFLVNTPQKGHFWVFLGKKIFEKNYAKKKFFFGKKLKFFLKLFFPKIIFFKKIFLHKNTQKWPFWGVSIKKNFFHQFFRLRGKNHKNFTKIEPNWKTPTVRFSNLIWRLEGLFWRISIIFSSLGHRENTNLSLWSLWWQKACLIMSQKMRRTTLKNYF